MCVRGIKTGNYFIAPDSHKLCRFVVGINLQKNVRSNRCDMRKKHTHTHTYRFVCEIFVPKQQLHYSLLRVHEKKKEKKTGSCAQCS